MNNPEHLFINRQLQKFIVISFNDISLINTCSENFETIFFELPLYIKGVNDSCNHVLLMVK